jgi:hypothetical protein
MNEYQRRAWDEVRRAAAYFEGEEENRAWEALRDAATYFEGEQDGDAAPEDRAHDVSLAKAGVAAETGNARRVIGVAVAYLEAAGPCERDTARLLRGVENLIRYLAPLAFVGLARPPTLH